MTTPANASDAYKKQITGIVGDVFNVLHYGTVTADDITAQSANRIAFQAAIDAAEAAGGGTVIIPPAPQYYYDRCLLIKPGVTVRIIDDSTQMILDQTEGNQGTGWNQWPLYANFQFGVWNALNLDLLTAYALNAVTIGAYSVTTTTAANAGNFAAGDAVWIRSTSSYVIGTDDIPTIGQINIVESINAGTGAVTLRYENEFANTSEILNLISNSFFTYFTPYKYQIAAIVVIFSF